MFRIKPWLIGLACLCAVSASAESASLISQERIRANEVNYRTVTVETGAFERTVRANAVEYYPHTCTLAFEGESAKFGGFEVVRGDEVKKGDVLATFVLEKDEVALASLEMELARVRDGLESYVESEEKAIEKQQQALLKVSGTLERQLQQLRIQRSGLALEQYVHRRQTEIAALEEQIAELKESMADSVLVAPMDGVVLDMAYPRVGETVYGGDVLMTLNRTDGMLLRVDNTSGYFRCGMEVCVEVGPNNRRVALDGRVVGADELVPAEERSGYAYIEFDNPDDVKLTRPSVSAPTVRVGDVMRLKRSAVAMEAGKRYVLKLSGGVAQKRFINCVYENNAEYTWILQGLEPGEEIIVE